MTLTGWWPGGRGTSKSALPRRAWVQSRKLKLDIKFLIVPLALWKSNVTQTFCPHPPPLAGWANPAPQGNFIIGCIPEFLQIINVDTLCLIHPTPFHSSVYPIQFERMKCCSPFFLAFSETHSRLPRGQ